MAHEGLNRYAVVEFENRRAELGVSYRELSKRTGLNTGTLSKYLAGNTSIRLDTWQVLCDGLGVDLLTIVSAAEKRMKEQRG